MDQKRQHQRRVAGIGSVVVSVLTLGLGGRERTLGATGLALGMIVAIDEILAARHASPKRRNAVEVVLLAVTGCYLAVWWIFLRR